MTWPFKQEEYLLTYQNQLDVIQELKGKAWKATHYSVLGQAAVLALYRLIDCPSFADKLWLTGLSLVVFFWAFLLVNNLQGGVCVRREATKYLRTLERGKADSLTFNEVWVKIKEENKPPVFWNLWKRWKNDWPISLAYVAVIFVPPPP